MAVMDGSKTSRRKKIFFVKKWTYGTYGLPAGPKMGQFFFLAAPKFYPRQKDPKRVLSAGAWGLVPKSAVWGPPNPEIRNLRPPKFGKKNFFRTCNIFFPKVHPKRSLTHPHRPPSDQNCPKARGSNFCPMRTCHVLHAAWPAETRMSAGMEDGAEMDRARSTRPFHVAAYALLCSWFDCT